MAMPRGWRGWVDAVAVAASLWLGPAGAAERGMGFGPPAYDAVVPGPPRDGLTDYRFLGGHDWPAIRFFAPRPLDCGGFGVLALPVRNPADTVFRLLLRIDDRLDANGDDRSLTGTIDLPPHADGTVILRLDAAPIGMVGRPPGEGPTAPSDLPVRSVRGSVDLAHVMALHLSGVRTMSDRQVLIGNPVLRTAPAGRPGPLVDAFGQAIAGTWPEKVVSTADLRDKRRGAEAQTRRLARDLVPPIDRFGGVDPDTRLAATGFFRVERTAGRWSLVTPAGHRFFSLGVDAVSASNPTIVEGRRALFPDLPATREGAAATFDVGQADLERGLGPRWPAAWRDAALRRLEAWGFNTLGNWSSAPVTGAGRMPFVDFYDVEGASAEVPMPGGRSLADPFDPRFAGVADAVAAAMTATHRDDPLLLGYFSGNELPWGAEDRPERGIAVAVLGLGPDSPAKLAFVEELRHRYGTVAAFASAWDIEPPPGWDDLLRGALVSPSSLTAAARRDAVLFQGRFAALYFGTVAQAIRRHDPHHLYLGTRFADAPPEVVEACARWCDVLSFNVYGRSPEERAEAWRRFEKPVLIGEFHFGSADRGSFWPGMVEVGSEAERGPAYAAYVADAVEDPQVVGAHWYQYADEPLTGRPYDGENGHIGLVAVTDIPYAGFVEAVADANRRVMARFAQQGRPDLRGTQ